MKYIYNSLDIGSDTIKVVVCEYYNNKYNVLASSVVKSSGVKNGLIVDAQQASSAIKEAINKASLMLGVNINKVITTVPSNNAKYTLVEGSIEINNDEGKITGNDIVNVLSNAMFDIEEQELVTVIPVNFKVDDKIVKNPKTVTGKTLTVKAIMVTTPKKNVYSVISTLESIGISTVDVTLGNISDYHSLKFNGTDTSVGIIVNIGYDKTDVGVFNKGILVSSNVINAGSKGIDNDLRYIYHISNTEARTIKEKFAVSHKRYSEVNEILELTNDKHLKINQYELSEVITSRLNVLLKEVKNSINNLTNKQISYIIVTGGITEMPGFKANAEMILGNIVTIAKLNMMGVRNNIFSTALGTIYMFNKKLELRDKKYSMFDEEDEDNIVTAKRNTTADGVLGKIVGYFTDN